MTNPIADFEKADTILITGSNTTTSHPVISTYIKRAVRNKNTKLIVVDPRGIKITDHATKWLQPKLGTDVAWINGLLNVIISEDLYDKAFVAKRTEGFEQMKAAVAKFTPDYVAEITGLTKEDIIETARLYANAKAASIAYCMGITQHVSGTDNVKSLANLAMLCGNMGIEGGGVNPLRGQNNVQGACDMGALPNVFTGYQPVSNDDVVKKMEDAWGVTGMSNKPGLMATEMVPKALDKEVRALYIIGENPLVSDPDLNHAEKCFKSLDFMVVQDIFLSETAELADVVLPASCFAEKSGTFSNTERKIQLIRKAVEAPGEAMDDWKIICELSKKMGYEMSYATSSDVMDEIARVTPSYGGVSYDRLEKRDTYWPCPDADHPGTPILHVGRFVRGLGAFQAIDYIAPDESADKDYPMSLTTGRVLYQYHSRTMTAKSDGLNECAPDSFVEISPQDAKKLEIEDGSTVTVFSRRGKISARAHVTHRIGDGNVFIPFHFAEAAANRLTNAALDPTCKIPEFKVCAVKLVKAG